MSLPHQRLLTLPPLHLPLLCYRQRIPLHPLPYSIPKARLVNSLLQEDAKDDVEDSPEGRAIIRGKGSKILSLRRRNGNNVSPTIR
ncbi:hypothetical protein AX14_002163, partial [Amanita brunnescens Koide BX004]